VWFLTDIEASSVRTEIYYCKNTDIDKAAIITKKGDIDKPAKLHGV